MPNGTSRAKHSTVILAACPDRRVSSQSCLVPALQLRACSRAASSPSLPAQPPAGPEGAHIPGFGQPVAVPWLKVPGKEPARLESSGVRAAGLGAWGTTGCRGVATTLRVPVPVPGGQPAEPCPCPCKDMVRAGTAVAGAGSTRGCQEGCQRVGSRQPSPPPGQPLSSLHSSWLGWSQPSAGAEPWRPLSSPTSSSPLAPGRCSTEPGRQQGNAEPGCWQRCRGAPSPGVPAVPVQEPPRGCAQSRARPRCRRQRRSAGTAHGALTVSPCPPPTFTPFPQELGAAGLPRVPQGWAQPAPTQALLPGAAEPRWQPGAEDRGQQRTLGRVLSSQELRPPLAGGEGPEPGEQHPHSGSMIPSWGAAPHPAEQHLNPESSSPIPESRIPVRGAGPRPGEQHPHVPGAGVPRGHPPCPPPPRSRTHERLLREARGDAVRGSRRSAHWGGRRRAKRPVRGQ